MTDSAPSKASGSRGWRGLRNCVVFLLALWAGGHAIQFLLPVPPVGVVADKWWDLRAKRAYYDTLFVGSSRFYYQIIPRQFDRETAAAGVPTHSYNFGSAGMWPPESLYVLREVLALGLPKLKWVFIELKPVDAEVDERSEETIRMLYWHDWRHTRMALREIYESKRPAAEKQRLVWAHTKLFFRQTFNLGMGIDLIAGNLRPSRRKAAPWLVQEGFRPKDDAPIDAEELGKMTRYIKGTRDGVTTIPMLPMHADAIRAAIAAVRRAGATPIFITAPSANHTENFSGVPDGAPYFAFTDPHRYPSLFDPALRIDSVHLNKAGAVEFTRFLSERFIEWRKPAPAAAGR